MGANKERLQRLEKERLGEERVMKCGLKCTIIEYPNSKHITVEFENGKIVKNKSYAYFLIGNINDGKRYSSMKHKSLVGEKIDKLLVLDLKEKIRTTDSKFEYFYSCRCDCGRYVTRGSQSLRDKNTFKSCGQCPKDIEETINYKYPNMIKYFKDIDDVFKYKCGSHEYVDMICDKCKYERKIQIKHMLSHGFSCPICSDSISYPEKFMIGFLNQTKLEFIREKKFDWSNNKRYDFYIPSLSCIIETNGEQHYKNTNRNGARTLRQEKENDLFKEEVAKANGIKEYIQIDCRKSEMDFIIKSIKESKLVKLIDITKIDFLKCNEYAVSNIVKEVCDIWNTTEIKNTTLISKQMGFSRRAISEYLKLGNELGWCEYNPKESCQLYRDNSRIGEYNKRKVKCIELNLVFNSIKECCNYMIEYTGLNFIHTGVSASCSGKRSHYRNYHFEYIN